MFAIDLLKRHRAEFEKLRHYFPEIVETAQRVKVIPWEDRFNVADKEPEIYDRIVELKRLLKSGHIDEETYNKCMSELQPVHVSKTTGIAFIERMEVAFREPDPPFGLVLHEVGHCHYKEGDEYWSARYSGGEVLVQITLLGPEAEDNVPVVVSSDAQVRKYMDMLRRADKDPGAVANEILDAIMPLFDAAEPDEKPARSLLALLLYAGVISLEMSRLGIASSIYEAQDKQLESLPHTSYVVRDFLSNTIEGLCWNDSFFVAYALRMGIVSPKETA